MRADKGNVVIAFNNQIIYWDYRLHIFAIDKFAIRHKQ